jgi:S-adenosylmethionine/arginine decarboxylase-like enzyme
VATETPSPVVVDLRPSEQMRDLAPAIYRQRLVIEGTAPKRIDDEAICGYLTGLARICDMTVLIDPVTHRSEQFGWAGWVHWETSGAHFYAWDEPSPFFSVDIYTCKAFDPQAVVSYTQDFFSADALVAASY